MAMRRAAYAILLASALIAGCASNSTRDRNAGEELEVRPGVVEEVRQVPLPGSSGGYIGTIGGGAVGGIAGGTVGSGRGSQAAAVAGAVAGSVAGRGVSMALCGIQPIAFCFAKTHSRYLSQPSSNLPLYLSAHSFIT